MNSTQIERLNELNKCVGMTVGQILDKDTTDTSDILAESGKHDLTKRKGSLGVVVEWLVTGVRGDNISAPDWGDYDIKAVQVKSSKKNTIGDTGMTFCENMRVTKVNYNEIVTTPYAESSLAAKSKMIVLMFEFATKEVPLHDRVLVAIGTIDLTSHTEQVTIDYNIIQAAAAAGEANTLRSTITQPGKLIKVYSSGAGKNMKTYKSTDGSVHTAKGKAFYIYKKELVELLVVL